MKRKIPKIINQQFKMDSGTNGINIGALQNVVYGAVHCYWNNWVWTLYHE